MSLFAKVAEPDERSALIGLPASAAEVMSLLSIILLSFPVIAAVVKYRMPPVAVAGEPLMKQYLTVFELASFVNCIVEVPAVAETLLLVIVISFVAPVAFTRPSIVTLSAPLRFIRGLARSPEIVTPVIVGNIVTDEKLPLPVSTAEPVSTILPVILISKSP